MTASYPDTTLRDDALDPPYGGRPMTEFGGLAWTWASNTLRFLGQAFLDYLRQPFTTQVFAVDSAVSPTDVVVVDLSNPPLTQWSYLARKVEATDSGVATVKVLGVAVQGAAVGTRCRVAVAGLLPRLYVGTATFTAGQAVTVDFTTGKLRVATSGEEILGYADPRGNVLLLALARGVAP